MLARSGTKLSGMNMMVDGNVPLGAGLSSSASLEVAVGYALLDRSEPADGTKGGHGSLDLTQLAKLCQQAENEFVGARCGIMDQFVSCHGVADHALMLDCRSLEMRLLPVPPH